MLLLVIIYKLYSLHSQEWDISAVHINLVQDEDEELSRLLSQGADEKPEKVDDDIIVILFVHVADENATQEPTELEASSVKEAALDDKLGVELRSIVEQIQVAGAHPGAPGAHPGAPERWDGNSGGGRRWVWCEFAALLEWFQAPGPSLYVTPFTF